MSTLLQWRQEPCRPGGEHGLGERGERGGESHQRGRAAAAQAAHWYSAGLLRNKQKPKYQNFPLVKTTAH